MNLSPLTLLQWFTYTDTKQKSWKYQRDFYALAFIEVIKWELDE